MSTNFPTNYDDNTVLGGPFVDAAPPVDPLRNIAATPRNNLNDTVFAIEQRIGKLGATISSTLDWATLTVGGVPSQGLRFAGTHAAWPGLQAESGLFVNSADDHVCYHQTGDPLGTFTDLTAGGTTPTWDILYAASNTMAINTVGRDVTWTSSIPGLAFEVERTVAFATQTAPMVRLLESGPDDLTVPKALLSVEGGSVHIDYRGITNINGASLEVWRQPAGKFLALHSGTEASPVSDILTFDYYGRMNWQAALGAVELLTLGYNATPVLSIHTDGSSEQWATSTVPALSVQQNTAGMPIASFKSSGPVRWGVSENGKVEQIADVASPDAGCIIKQYGTGQLLQLAVPDLIGPKPRWQFYRDGSTRNTAESTDPCLRLQQSSAGDLLELIDTSGGVNTRLRTALTGATFVTGSSTIAGPLLTLDQSADGTAPIFEVVGVSDVDESKNISTMNGDGVVTGPKNYSSQPGWDFTCMVKIKVNGGEIWVPGFVPDLS